MGSITHADETRPKEKQNKKWDNIFDAAENSRPILDSRNDREREQKIAFLEHKHNIPQVG